jgi:hypothetical protein
VVNPNTGRALQPPNSALHRADEREARQQYRLLRQLIAAGNG